MRTVWKWTLPEVALLSVLLPISGGAPFVYAEPQSAPVEEDIPPGVEQLLPRGAIPAIFEPVFVRADSAEIPDDAWIFGVELNGETRAYSLNLLNHHEVVNDVIGGLPVAPVW